VKNKKRIGCGILAAILTAMLILTGAGADGTAKRGLTLHRPVPQRTRGTNPLIGTMETATCEPVELELDEDTAAAGAKYAYSIGILDGTNPDRDGVQIADLLYIGQPTTETIFSYTFYQAGRYVMFIDLMDENEGITATLYQSITVTESEWDNPLMNEVQRVADLCRQESEFDTALAIDEYLCANVAYDYNYVYYSAEGALLEGTGTCSAYTRAFELIGKECGLEVYRACGEATNIGGTGNHTWNAVKIDGNWYHIDSTWNDNGSESNHMYFGLTDALISEDHTLEHYAQGKSCSCDRMDCNYFIHENMLEKLETYDINREPVLQTIPQTIQARFDEGITVYDEETDRELYLIDDSGLSVLFWADFPWPLIREILMEGLPKHVFTAQGEKVTVAIEATEDERLRVAITGWDTEESGTIETPEELTTIEAGAFEGTDATTVILTENCREIGSRAFAGSAVRTIVIPAGVTEIERDAFDECGKILIIAEDETEAAELATEKGYLRITPNEK